MLVRPSSDNHKLVTKFKNLPLGLVIFVVVIVSPVMLFFLLDILNRYGLFFSVTFLICSIIIMKINTFLHEKIHQKTHEAITGKSGKIHFRWLKNSYFIPESECYAPQYRVIALGPLITISFFGVFTSIVLFLPAPNIIKYILLFTLLTSFIGSASDLYVFIKLRKYNNTYIVLDTPSHVEVYKKV
ncbi:MAG: hypothetical protein A4E56_03170 [Pelotomaculum sp. PtaU1.Bin065]|nr:MAG: hypothetical protein A4E56_03170 [Pelotomaculum sp. PtaU1.Bin065]